MIIVSVYHFRRHVVISFIANVKMIIRAWLAQNVTKDWRLQAFLPEQHTCRQCFQRCQPCNVPQGVETRFLQYWGHFSLAGFCSVYQWVITCSAELSSSTGSLPCGRTVGVKKERRRLCLIYCISKQYVCCPRAIWPYPTHTWRISDSVYLNIYHFTEILPF